MRINRTQAVPIVISVIAIAILLMFTIFFSLQPLITIIGVIVGAVISITSQYWTQRLAWKRDYSLKAIEQIYSPLYGVILPIEKILEKKDYENTSFGHWDSCVKDYRYFMVDTKFRETLDSFHNRIDKRSKVISKLETIIIPKIQTETATEIFSVKAQPNRDLYLEIEFYHSQESIGGTSVGTKFHLKKQENRNYH